MVIMFSFKILVSDWFQLSRMRLDMKHLMLLWILFISIIYVAQNISRLS